MGHALYKVSARDFANHAHAAFRLQGIEKLEAEPIPDGYEAPDGKMSVTDWTEKTKQNIFKIDFKKLGPHDFHNLHFDKKFPTGKRND